LLLGAHCLQVGEHESCGPGNLAVSGFTYNPETFMAAKIGVYNISWRDMGVPTLEKMMDIVQVRLALNAGHSS
jgi:protein tyrosine phosphatase domain-containing protein 1